MPSWLATGFPIAILAAGPVIALLVELRARLAGRAPAAPSRPPRAGEPCWTETVGRDEHRIHARGACVDDELMEMDARAARGDFPIPRSEGAG